MKQLTKWDLELAFTAGEMFARSGGDNRETPNFEKWFEYEYCIDGEGHDWVDNAKDIGKFYCNKCGRYK